MLGMLITKHFLRYIRNLQATFASSRDSQSLFVCVLV